MTDFFKSAFGIFGQNAGAGGGPGSQPGGAVSSTNAPGFMNSIGSGGNDFVGSIIQVGSSRLRVTRVLAEGGYAIVYVAQDTTTGVDYALKVKRTIDLDTFFRKS